MKKQIKRSTIWIPDDLLKELNEEAKFEPELSKSGIIRTALREYLAKKKAERETLKKESS